MRRPLVLLFALTGSAFGQAEFIDLGTLYPPIADATSEAVDISYDGTTVVGVSGASSVGIPDQGFRWRRSSGMWPLGSPAPNESHRALSISPDGSRVGGTAEFTGQSAAVATLWDPASERELVPAYSELNRVGDRSAYFVGRAAIGNAVLWDRPGGSGPVALDVSYPVSIDHFDVSSDGLTLATTVFTAAGPYSSSGARIWSDATTSAPLSGSWSPINETFVVAISGDGSTVIGTALEYNFPNHRRYGFVWSEAAGPRGFGVNGAFEESTAPTAVSHDGSHVLIGSFLWTEAAGRQWLPDLFAAGGVTLPNTASFRGMSADGNAFFGTSNGRAFVAYLSSPSPQVLGTPYCSPIVPNSTGAVSTTEAVGSIVAMDNEVTLVTTGLPTSVFGFYLVSRTPGFIAAPIGSVGNLCLGGSIGRYHQQGAVTGGTDRIDATINLLAMQTGAGPVAAQSGETWHFQLWHRDLTGGPLSNFSAPTAVTFE